MEKVIDQPFDPFNYRPSTDEPYMNGDQLKYFKNKLIQQKIELVEKTGHRMEKIKNLKYAHADIIDRSNSWIDIEAEITVFERHSLLIKEIEKALERIEDGTFGYCEFTGKKIGIKRLEAMPCATLSIEALESLEEIRN
ncbi:MAG: transcriptional regulator, TraR/DksA family protein [Desulfobacteraceae bacterium]|nr:MAG: transcriptional regulator, TraR/DksA family protein [Desulfobacteraceae bacterium]